MKKNKNRKKITLSLGAITLIAAPFIGIISCGDKAPNKTPTNGDKIKFDKITSDQVKKILESHEDFSKPVSDPLNSDPGTLNNIEINELKDMSISITNWSRSKSKQEITFDAKLTKSDLSKKFSNIILSGYDRTNQDEFNHITPIQIQDQVYAVVDKTKTAGNNLKPSDIKNWVYKKFNITIKLSSWLQDDDERQITFDVELESTGLESRNMKDLVLSGFAYTNQDLINGVTKETVKFSIEKKINLNLAADDPLNNQPGNYVDVLLSSINKTQISVQIDISNWLQNATLDNITFDVSIASTSEPSASSVMTGLIFNGFAKSDQNKLDAVTSTQITEAISNDMDIVHHRYTAANSINKVEISTEIPIHQNGLDMKIIVTKWTQNLEPENNIIANVTLNYSSLTSKAFKDITITSFASANTILSYKNNNEPNLVTWDSANRILTIKQRVTGIGTGIKEIYKDNMFEGTPIKEINFEPNSAVTEIKANSFSGGLHDETQLEKVTIPPSVINIDTWAFFNNSKLLSLTFEAGSKLEEIGYGAFDGAISLKELTIPESVNKISNGAFEESPLTSLIIEGGIPNGTIRPKFLAKNGEVFSSTHISNIKDSATESATDWQTWAKADPGNFGLD